MSDTSLNKIIQYGTAAARVAFVPAPAVGSQVLYIWYDTDSAPDTYIWDGAAWVIISRPIDASSASLLLGRGSAGGAGPYEEISLDASLVMDTTILKTADGRLVSEGTLTNAQILTLNTVPITVVGTPGAGFAILPSLMYINLDSSGGAYTGNRIPNFTLNGNNCLLEILDLDSGPYQHMETLYFLNGDFENVDLLLECAVGNPGGGNAANTLYYKVWYTIVPVI